MGFLAPLYALAALAVVGPVILHLIRRQPQGQTQFSSLMFLSPSPPRLTRRSRLDNLLLLLLRALAIGLIAIAFTRPFLRQESFLNKNLSGRNIIVLFDTSASMQREDVWQRAQEELASVLDGLAADDRISLYTIDDTLNAIVPLDPGQIADGAASQQAVRRSASDIVPSWRRTELAVGLSAACDLLTGAAIAGTIDAGTSREIVLITDLHSDSGFESLQGYPWPEAIRLDVRRILPTVAGNAWQRWMMPSEEDGPDTYRVRIENSADSDVQTFGLAWSDQDGPIESTMTRVQVPAGQVRVVPMTSIPTGADRLLLSGDAWTADNHLFVVQAKPQISRIGFCGTTQTRREDDCGYFLKQAPLSTRLVRREVVAIDADRLPEVLGDPEFKAIVLEPTSEVDAHAKSLRSFAQAGGTVIVCLARIAADAVEQSVAGRPVDHQRELEQAATLDVLFDSTGFEISEAETKDFALFGSIDYRDPVFAPFADPRFNDFSKIRFWSHRNIKLPRDDTIKTVSSFDDGAPMLVQQACGSGRIWLLTAGWQPAASTLGLSSKFVPILSRLLDPGGRASSEQLSYEVGEKIRFRDSTRHPIRQESQPPLDSSGVVVMDSSGNTVEEGIATVDAEYVQIFAPGVYRLQTASHSREVTVQVPASESRLLPLDIDVFEQYGVGLGKLPSAEERIAEARQMHVTELERKQRLWQWLIAASILVLAVETWLAGRFARERQGASAALST